MFASATALLFGTLLLSSTNCRAQQPHLESLKRFESKRHGIAFRYNDAFEVLQSPASQAVALLKHRVEGFPTFNVLLQGAAFDAAQYNASTFTKRILDDYAKVGILNPKVVRTVRSAVGTGIDSWTTELEYKVGESLMIAGVSLVGAGDHHYVLTYIDNAATYYQRKGLREEIIETFTLSDLEPGALDDSSGAQPARSSGEFYLIAALVVSFGALALMVWRRKR